MTDSDNNLAANQRNQFICPVCLKKARIRFSRRLSPVYAHGVVECQDISSCGWRGSFAVELLATITPSLQPTTSAINLPLSPYALQKDGMPRKSQVTTKNPFDPHRDQMLLFENK
ncbi:ogr/Delta-like zinc finger family protein [Cellvibrio mixtus]|uniref:ogr/Delta-like zinc finger family protein n=1 Tax=Cellvibrio mixtus TaxID=39650 RepID=UPI000587239B|nr:ogr/Delta-like zinc finger family protein [Cellvibrio mixtus]